MGIATTNPATGEIVRTYDALTDEELEQKLACAHEAAHGWRQLPLAERAKVVRAAGELLDADRDRWATIMTSEMGKLLTAARDEAAKCATTCRWYADHATELLAREKIEIDGEEGYLLWQPLGVVLAVMPWNFPFWQVIRFAAPALVAGNVGILKHASSVPQCALALEELFRRAGAPEGVFQSLLIGSQPIAKILGDDRVAAATLTGSEAAGSSVASIAGKQIKKTVLELGGSDPFIVMPSADLEQAVQTAVKARTINNGQSCIAAKRFIVHEQVADAFTKRFVEVIAALRVGDPMQEETQVGPLASAQVRDDLEKQVGSMVAAGARVLTGGKRIDGPGFYFQPTVVEGLPRTAPVYQEETFGPLATIFRARSVEEAIEIANDSRFGLGSAAWTNDEREIGLLVEGLVAGSVFINGMVASDARFPFGGVKKSGYGRELSAMGMHEFMNAKTVRIKRSSGAGLSSTE